MDFFMGYVKNIVIFMLVLSMILNLYPKSVFEKYIRMFAGLLLILLILQPWLHLRGKEISLSDYLEEITVDAEANLQKDREQLENKILERIGEQYENF